MRNFEQDLRFFEQELERERDPFRRNLLLKQICDIKKEMYKEVREERAQLERENKNFSDALDAVTKTKKK
jgi:protein subunit release factor B